MAIMPQSSSPTRPEGRWNARLYDGFLSNTARFRNELRADLSGLTELVPDLLSDVLLCGTEMFANAVQHTRSGQSDGRVIRTLSVSPAEHGTTLRLSVIDDGLPESPSVPDRPGNTNAPDNHAALPQIPNQRTTQEWQEAESGRGLLLLDHLATAWGTGPVVNFPFCEGLGTVVWAEFVCLSPSVSSSSAEVSR